MTEQHDDQLSPIDGVTEPPPPREGAITGELGSDQPVARPTLPPEGQPMGYPDEDAIQAVADLQRAVLAQPAGNVIHGAPHFLRNVDGDEVCGQCGDPWECDGYRQLRAQNTTIAPGEPGLPQVMDAPPTMREAAEAAGIDVHELQARLDRMRRR